MQQLRRKFMHHSQNISQEFREGLRQAKKKINTSHWQKEGQNQYNDHKRCEKQIDKIPNHSVN